MASVAWRGFYAILDPMACVMSPTDTAEAILRGGCAVLQLRSKTDRDRETLELARALKKLCAAHAVPFVMNDRIDLALLAEADGVHLGQDDMPIEDARRLFDGPIGLSTHDLAQARSASEHADLIGFGPVFDTPTKKNPDPTVGLDALREVCDTVGVPVVAIGGLTLERSSAVVEAGATMGAAISAVCASDDPAANARAFHEAWS